MSSSALIKNHNQLFMPKDVSNSVVDFQNRLFCSFINRHELSRCDRVGEAQQDISRQLFHNSNLKDFCFFRRISLLFTLITVLFLLKGFVSEVEAALEIESLPRLLSPHP